MADRKEADLFFKKIDVYKVYWLNRDLLLENPLLTVLSPKKVMATKGRPYKTAIFTANEKGIF